MPRVTRTPPAQRGKEPRRRADAERSVERILDAALDALASDPEHSMAEIARRAGVVRATIYVHFPTREALIDAVTDRAISEVADVVERADPARGDPAEALGRVVAAAWRALGQFHALVAINARLPQAELHRRHLPILEQLHPLIERGQREGTFRADVPATWHLSMMLALVHAATNAAHGDRTPGQVEDAVVATVLGAVSNRC